MPARSSPERKLPSDYPMAAPNYAAHRKELAVKIGLGRKPLPAAPAPGAHERRKAVSAG